MRTVWLALAVIGVSVVQICGETHGDSDNGGALSVLPEQPTEDEDDGVEVAVEQTDNIEYDPDLVFYPTNEWQPVQKNQAIPSGLHVRLNLETGQREAKLMEGDDGAKYWRHGDRQGMVNPKSKYFSREELKAALKDFKAEAVDEETTRRREASIKKKFKKYEELKKDLESMKLDIKTDGEIITTLVERLKEGKDGPEDTRTILTNLEYYLHQIDNAVMFCDLGGMTPLMALINHTDAGLRSSAAFVIGSATQSNSKVQVCALGAGCLPQLIRLLSTDNNNNVRKRSLYAISSIARQFPLAQQKFLQLGGVTALSQLFRESGTETLRLKAVTLLNDLLLEQEHIKEMDPNDSNVKQRIIQYKQVPLLKTMLEQGWCDLVPVLLNSPEHDVREKTLTAMVSLKEPCKRVFSKSYARLQTLQKEYQRLAYEEEQESSEDRYFMNLLESVKTVMVDVTQKEEL